MNYRFENTYSYADFLKWGVDIRNILSPQSLFSSMVLTAYFIQLVMWVPIFLMIMPLKISMIVKAIILFSAIIIISRLYESFIFPWLMSYFDRKNNDNLPEKFESVIEVNDIGIRTKDRGHETLFTWDAFHGVVDIESKVIFLSDTIHCVIPAKCFSGFLEKDAFVRDCNQRIDRPTAQGAAFT